MSESIKRRIEELRHEANNAYADLQELRAKMDRIDGELLQLYNKLSEENNEAS